MVPYRCRYKNRSRFILKALKYLKAECPKNPLPFQLRRAPSVLLWIFVDSGFITVANPISYAVCLFFLIISLSKAWPDPTS